MKQTIVKRVDSVKNNVEYVLTEKSLIGEITMIQTLHINYELQKIFVNTDRYVNGLKYDSTRKMAIFDILDMDNVAEYCKRLDNSEKLITTYTRLTTIPWRV